MSLSEKMLPVTSSYPRVRLRHPWPRVQAALCIIMLVLLVRAFALGKIEWSVVAMFLTAPAIIAAFGNTLWMTVLAMALGIALGLIAALMRLSSNPVANIVASGYIWFFRGTP